MHRLSLIVSTWFKCLRAHSTREDPVMKTFYKRSRQYQLLKSPWYTWRSLMNLKKFILTITSTTEIYAHNIDATTNPAANDVRKLSLVKVFRYIVGRNSKISFVITFSYIIFFIGFYIVLEFFPDIFEYLLPFDHIFDHFKHFIKIFGSFFNKGIIRIS